MQGLSSMWIDPSWYMMHNPFIENLETSEITPLLNDEVGTKAYLKTVG